MKYIDFRRQIKYPIFTTQELQLLLPQPPSATQLSRWHQQNLLIQLTRGVYLFADAKNQITLPEIANLLITPSYLSLEYALFHFNLIPEITPTATCITTKNNRQYQTYLGSIRYQHLKPSLYFGYRSQSSSARPYYLAEPEKALLDFFYLHPSYHRLSDLQSLRLNQDSLIQLNWSKLINYSQLFPQRVQYLISLLRKTYARS